MLMIKNFFRKSNMLTRVLTHICAGEIKVPKNVFQKESIYMLLHPHWWYEDNPFEHEYSN